MNTLTITISRRAREEDDLIAVPRRELNALIERADMSVGVSEKDILRWSREARALKRAGKLSMLRSLRPL